MSDRRAKYRSKYTLDRQVPGAFEGETITRRRFMTGSANAAGAIAGGPHDEIEPLVVLLVHQHVGARVGAELVPPHLERPVLLVVDRVEEPGRVRAPRAGSKP